MHILPCSSKVECRRRKIEILWLALDWKMRLGAWVGWEGHPLIDSDWLNPPGFSVGGGASDLTSWWLRFKLVSVDFWPLYYLPHFTLQNNLTDVSANAFHLSKASPKPFNSQTSKSLHSSPRFGSQSIQPCTSLQSVAIFIGAHLEKTIDLPNAHAPHLVRTIL